MDTNKEIIDRDQRIGLPDDISLDKDRNPEAVEERLYRWVKAKDRLPDNRGYYTTKRPALMEDVFIVKEEIFNPKYDDIKERWISFEYEWLEEIAIKEHLPVEDFDIEKFKLQRNELDTLARNEVGGLFTGKTNIENAVRCFKIGWLTLVEKLNKKPSLEEQPLNEDEKPLVNVYADEYVEKFWFEQPKDVQRKMKMAYLAGFHKNSN